MRTTTLCNSIVLRQHPQKRMPTNRYPFPAINQADNLSRKEQRQSLTNKLLSHTNKQPINKR